MVEHEEGEEAEGMSRRQFVKYAMAAGMVGLTASSVAGFQSLLPGEGRPKGELRLTFEYMRPPADDASPWWWEARIGQVARPEHFQEWDGAVTWWRGRYDEKGFKVPNVGFPALVIRVPPDLIEAPDDFDGYIADEGILAFIDKCVHLCCNPGWHRKPVPEGNHAVVPIPSLDAARQDPIYCICHLSQFDPLQLVWNKHPNGVEYVGARRVGGPADRALPAIPIKVEGGEIVGDSEDPKWSLDWYGHCQ